MIDEVHRVTSSAAQGIVAEYPAMRKLLEEYERLEDKPQAAQRLLAQHAESFCSLLAFIYFSVFSMKVDHRQDGQKTASGRGHDKLAKLCRKEYIPF